MCKHLSPSRLVNIFKNKKSNHHLEKNTRDISGSTHNISPIRKFSVSFVTYHFLKPLQGGPLPIISEVISPINGLING